jgi:hypothetical protein
MSTATMIQRATIPGIPPWVPTSFYRLTLEQYEAMVEAGILGKNDRVHVDGQVEVYSRPGAAGYESLEVLAPGHVLAVVVDGVEVGQIPVADILP